MNARVAAALLIVLGATAPAGAHGASKGLHLHVDPDPAAPGSRIVVRIDAAEPIREVRVAFSESEPVTKRPKRPRRSLRVELIVPTGADGTASLQAEAVTRDGRILRAAAILEIDAGIKGSLSSLRSFDTRRSPRRAIGTSVLFPRGTTNAG